MKNVIPNFPKDYELLIWGSGRIFKTLVESPPAPGKIEHASHSSERVMWANKRRKSG